MLRDNKCLNTLEGLIDVNIPDPENGIPLIYDSTSGMWISAYPDRTVTVAKSGGQFTSIQEGIDYAHTNWGDISNSNPAVVMVYPGVYTEQIHSYTGLWIVGIDNAHDPAVGKSSVQLYNTGADAAHYPLRSTSGDFVGIVGMTIITDAGGIVGSLIGSNFKNVYFKDCHWIESADNEGFMDFRNCQFDDSAYAGWNLDGTGLIGIRNIRLDYCNLQRNTLPTISSTHTGSFALMAWYNCSLDGALVLGGDWGFTTISTRLRSYGHRNTFSTDGKVYMQKVICENGIHFTVEPEKFRMINSSFKGTGTNYIPDGEADITSDVIIHNAEVNNTTTQNGLSAEIQRLGTDRHVGNTVDSYITIQAAIDASIDGDSVRVYPGMYNENIVLDGDIDLIGISRNNSIIYANDGTVLKKTTGESHIDRLTIRADPTYDSTSCYAIDISGGELDFDQSDCEISPTQTFVDAVKITGGLLKVNNSRFIYTNITSGGGVHRFIVVSEGGDYLITNSILRMFIADSSDDVIFLDDDIDTSLETELQNNRVEITCTDSTYSGTIKIINKTGTNNKSHMMANHFHAHGAGIGYIYYVNGSSGRIHSTGNSISSADGVANYFAFINSGNTLVSHFDDVVAPDGVIGNGSYDYVNSPADGDLQISGSYLNMYASALTVGARGADYTSIQDAIDAVTDAADNKRYVILIYPGTYTENVDLTGKPYIDLKAIGNYVDTELASTTGVTLTLPNIGMTITNLQILSINGEPFKVPSCATTERYYFNSCSMVTSSINTFSGGNEIYGGELSFSNCFIAYVQVGTGGGTHRLFNVLADAVINFNGSRTFMTVAATGDDVECINESNNVITTKSSASEFDISRSGVVTGETTFYNANGSSTLKDWIGNHIHIKNSGSGGTAQVIKTAGNGCEVHLTANRIRIEDFALNYLADIGATDSVMSHFDDVVSADESIGAGTGYWVHSHADGDFHTSRDIEVGRYLTVLGTLGLASGTTVNEITTTVSAPGSDDKLMTEKCLVDFTNGLAALYVKLDGSTSFTGAVAGQVPTLDAHLTTKGYVDGMAGGGGANDLGPFVNIDSTSSPVTIVIGNKYIMAGTGGGWSGGSINDVAESSDGTSWTFVTPVAGQHGWVTDQGIDYTFNGVNWVSTGTLIDHTTIQNVGVNTHAQIDTHIANVITNPHSVTKTNVGLGNVTDDVQLKRAANDFNGFGVKASPANNDRFLVEDSEDSFNKKYMLANAMPDVKVKVSSDDTTQDYLATKLIGSGAAKIVLTEVGGGGNETLRVDYGTELTTLTNGSNADSLHTHSIGWHGSPTRIKIGAAEFFPNDSKEWKQVIENDGGSIVDDEGKIAEMITIPIYIPVGYKATAYMVYASANIAIEIFENNITNNSSSSKGSGNANTEVDMTDTSTSTTNYLSIVVVEAGADVYGAYVTIESI